MHQNSFPYNSSYKNTTKCILPRYIISIIHCRTFWWNASKYILAKYNKTYAKYILPDKNQIASHPQYIKRQSDEIHHNKTHKKKVLSINILPKYFLQNSSKWILSKKKNIKLHPTKAHQIASFQSVSKCILPKRIKMHSTKAHQNASYQSASNCILPKYIKMHPTKVHPKATSRKYIKMHPTKVHRNAS